MITRIMSLFAFLVLLVSKPALAVVPEQGIWWNPSESGRGYGVELQDDYLFITYYAYGSAGQSAFYTSGGRYNTTTNSADLDFVGFSGGQCFGCAYPGRPAVTLLGNARVTFSSPMSGELRLPGGVVIPIQRQLFFGPEARTNLYGTWHLTSGALGVYFGDMLWIQSADDSIAGGFKGRIVDGSAQRILVGAPLTSGEIAMLVDSSTNYYTYYVFRWSTNRWGGRSWTYLKTSQPSGAGLLFLGSRILGKRHSETAASASTHATKDDQDAAVEEVFFSVRARAQGGEANGDFGSSTESLIEGDEPSNMARLLASKFDER